MTTRRIRLATLLVVLGLLALGASSGIEYFRIATTMSSGLGAVAQIAGPVDQALLIQAGAPAAPGVGRAITLSGGLANGAANAGGAVQFYSALAGSGTTPASLATLSAAGSYSVADGLGAVSHFIGPTDQTFAFASANDQDISLTPNGTGILLLSAPLALGGVATFDSGLGAVAQLVGPTDQALSLASAPGRAIAAAAIAPTAAAGASQAGVAATLSASAATASTDTDSAAAGGSLTLTAGAAARQGVAHDADGGDIVLTPGAGVGAGVAGVIELGGTAELSGALEIQAGLGAVSQIVGPSDQTLTIATLGDQDLALVPHGSGGITAGKAVTVADGLGAVAQLVGPTDQELLIATQNNQDISLDPNGTGVISLGADARSTATALTAGTMTANFSGAVRHAVHSYSWTEAMVIAAHGTADTIVVCTLPAKTIVKRVYVIIDTAATQGAALTVQVGPTGTTTGYILASDAKAVANTVYGTGIAAQGALLFTPGNDDDYHLEHLPSYVAATNVEAVFVIGAGDLRDVTASTGTIVIETLQLP